MASPIYVCSLRLWLSQALLNNHMLLHDYSLFYFFNKEHILISRRYQLHPASAATSCPDDIKDAHSQKREELQKKEKPHYRDP
jgi:hypothetical protein